MVKALIFSKQCREACRNSHGSARHRRGLTCNSNLQLIHYRFMRMSLRRLVQWGLFVRICAAAATILPTHNAGRPSWALDPLLGCDSSDLSTCKLLKKIGRLKLPKPVRRVRNERDRKRVLLQRGKSLPGRKSPEGTLG